MYLKFLFLFLQTLNTSLFMSDSSVPSGKARLSGSCDNESADEETAGTSV